MTKISKNQTLMALVILAMVLGLSIYAGPRAVSAQTDAVQFNVSTSMVENLAALKGKSVTVSLASGQTITGIVNDVKGNLLHLGKISQKEFYDALIAIDRISAVETRVR
jgi:hypothetical protein